MLREGNFILERYRSKDFEEYEPLTMLFLAESDEHEFDEIISAVELAASTGFRRVSIFYENANFEKLCSFVELLSEFHLEAECSSASICKASIQIDW